MKQREVIENWVDLLNLDQDSPDRVESFGDRKYKFGLYLLNQDGNALKLRKGAIHELVIEDDIMNWFHAGHVTVSNPDDILERATEIRAGDGPRSEKIKVKSTHGAGDVFAGVFCAAIASNEDLAKALNIANKKAAFHVAK